MNNKKYKSLKISGLMEFKKFKRFFEPKKDFFVYILIRKCLFRKALGNILHFSPGHVNLEKITVLHGMPGRCWVPHSLPALTSALQWRKYQDWFWFYPPVCGGETRGEGGLGSPFKWRALLYSHAMDKWMYKMNSEFSLLFKNISLLTTCSEIRFSNENY